MRRGRTFDIWASADISPKMTPNVCAKTAIQTVANIACQVALSGNSRYWKKTCESKVTA